VFETKRYHNHQYLLSRTVDLCETLRTYMYTSHTCSLNNINNDTVATMLLDGRVRIAGALY